MLTLDSLSPWLPTLYRVIAIAASIAAIPFLWFYAVQFLRIQLACIPPGLPWAGLRNERILPKLRAALRETKVKRIVIDEGYEKYSKQGKAFILPTLHWPEVVLPPHLTRWVASQPDSVLSTPAVQDDLVGPVYFTHGPDVAACHDFSVISRDLTRNIGRVTPRILQEIERSCRRQFDAASQGWHEIELAAALKKVAADAVSRIIVGDGLCWDERYHSRMHDWEMCFGYTGLVFRFMTPRILKPLLGTILGIPLKFMKWRVGRLLQPEVRKRLQTINEKHNTDFKEDLMQWTIESAKRNPDPRAMHLSNLTGRIMAYTMFAQHTTQISVATILLDLVSYPSGQAIQPALREEAKLIFERLPEEPYATKEMSKLDSTMRESMRLNPMFGKGIPKEVLQPGGITTPDGLFLPQGCHISTASASCTQRDGRLYKDAEEFVPLRFYELGEKQPSASFATEHFLNFSLGKHACPGRFFAVQVLKLMLGYILINYDLEPLSERPEFVTFGDMAMPPPTKVRVRLREKGE